MILFHVREYRPRTTEEVGCPIGSFPDISTLVNVSHQYGTIQMLKIIVNVHLLVKIGGSNVIYVSLTTDIRTDPPLVMWSLLHCG